MIVKRRRHLQPGAPQSFKLFTELLHPGHSQQEFSLLLLEELAQLLDLLHWRQKNK